MIARLRPFLVLLVSATLTDAALAQVTTPASPRGVQTPPTVSATRPIRRDIPQTNMIRRAFASSTRDQSGRPGPRYWQLWTDYKIRARLDSATSTIRGTETVSFRNNSDSAMRGIVLRLDQNIFRPDAPRTSIMDAVTSGMVITRLVVNGQALPVTDTVGNPIPGSTRRTTPLARVLRGTSARIPLATPIPAHGTGTFEADWSFEVPRIEGARGFRMGRWADTLYQVAQWYPRLAVFDDLRGWDTEQYLGDGEFYNNYGHFDVSIDVPAGWIVGATGVLQNPNDVLTPTARDRLSRVLTTDSTIHVVTAAERGPGRSTAAGTNGRLVWRFVADSVGDVAWATSNQFVWDAGRANIPTRGWVPFNIMYLPGHAQTYADGPRHVRHALEYYSNLWMPYAYPQLTMVDGPELGMEYPMFIMSAVFAADHETGHQWWPMMVGVNETWYGWMDEGFNQYMNILSDADRDKKPYTLDTLGLSYGEVSGNEYEPTMMWNENYDGPMYGFAAYGKAPLMLSSLGGVVGDSAVQRAMSEYAKAWRFKHPSPWDFANYMSSALHRDLGWFWYYWLFTTESVDGAIQSVVASGRQTRVTIRQDGEMPSPIVLKVEFAPGGSTAKPSNSTSSISPNVTESIVWQDANTAIVTYPVDIWFSGSRTYTVNLDFAGRRISRLTLDPNQRFPDHSFSDNVWPRMAATR